MIHFACKLEKFPPQWCRPTEPAPVRTNRWADVSCQACRRNARAFIGKHAAAHVDLFPPTAPGTEAA